MTSGFLRIPRPKAFLGFMSLQTGTELITLALLFNKVTGLYGLLAILTGFALSAFQLLTYLYSLGVLVLLVFLLPHIRRQSPLQCLSLAWLNIVDTLINAGCTAAFATNWFLGNDPHTAKGGSGDGQAPQDGQPKDDAPHIGPQDTIASMVLIVLFTLVRVYFSLVVASYARVVLQRWAEQEGADGKSANPFAVGAAEGDGWRGRLGRVLVAVGKGYWLEPPDEQDASWTSDMHSKFRGTGISPNPSLPTQREEEED